MKNASDKIPVYYFEPGYGTCVVCKNHIGKTIYVFCLTENEHEPGFYYEQDQSDLTAVFGIEIANPKQLKLIGEHMILCADKLEGREDK